MLEWGVETYLRIENICQYYVIFLFCVGASKFCFCFSNFANYEIISKLLKQKERKGWNSHKKRKEKNKNICKSFGDFDVFEYNKSMKKMGKILAIIFLVVPMVFGMMFLSPNLTHNSAQTAQNGGGGQTF